MRSMRFLAILVLTATPPLLPPAWAQGGVSSHRVTPAMRPDVYEQLKRAQTCVRDRDYDCAESETAALFDRDDLSSYERAQAWNFRAYLDFNREDIDSAITDYENLLAEADVPTGLQRQSQYSLARLYLSRSRPEDALVVLDQWWNEAEPSGPDPFVLRAQIAYQRHDYSASLAAIDTAIDSAGQRGADVEEGWYQLKNASLWALGEHAQAAETLETMLRLWPQRDYYIQLARIYKELGNDARKRDLYEAAYASGWLDHGADIITLAEYRIESGHLIEALNALRQNREHGYIVDGDALRSLIAAIRRWNRGEPINDEERETLIRNALLEQQDAERPRHIRL